MDAEHVEELSQIDADLWLPSAMQRLQQVRLMPSRGSLN